MTMVRVGSVQYLNALPLVHGLDSRPELFSLAFDVPSKCASMLHDKSVDLALIPTIEYVRRSDYLVVPDIAVASEGPVASVAVFTKRPTTAIRSIAIDSSSRTSVALLKILCARWFEIEPKFVIMRPDLEAMLKRCDAALLIGDTALFTEHETTDLEKIDLGEEWTHMTNLPFVWAFWVGRPGIVEKSHLEALLKAREEGVSALDAIAEKHGSDDEEYAGRAQSYLRDNVHFDLTERAITGLKEFYKSAYELGIVQQAATLRFYDK
mgnify:FL=1